MISIKLGNTPIKGSVVIKALKQMLNEKSVVNDIKLSCTVWKGAFEYVPSTGEKRARKEYVFVTNNKKMSGFMLRIVTFDVECDCNEITFIVYRHTNNNASKAYEIDYEIEYAENNPIFFCNHIAKELLEKIEIEKMQLSNQK